jgi:hypothetical protein
MQVERQGRLHFTFNSIVSPQKTTFHVTVITKESNWHFVMEQKPRGWKIIAAPEPPQWIKDMESRLEALILEHSPLSTPGAAPGGFLTREA